MTGRTGWPLPMDSSYYLLCALEVLDEDGRLERKADMFTKRTIKPHEAVTTVDTASRPWRSPFLKKPAWIWHTWNSSPAKPAKNWLTSCAVSSSVYRARLSRTERPIM